MRTYLIPANSKKSLLIFGIFNKFDITLFGIGVALSFLLVLTLPTSDVLWACIAVSPGIITGFLVFPVPNYHNVLTVIIETWEFFTTRQKFIWRGWCSKDVKEDKE